MERKGIPICKPELAHRGGARPRDAGAPAARRLKRATGKGVKKVRGPKRAAPARGLRQGAFRCLWQRSPGRYKKATSVSRPKRSSLSLGRPAA